ncbi:MAG: ABC transporter substrate-binding protein [Actinomycetota bacterium]
MKKRDLVRIRRGAVALVVMSFVLAACGGGGNKSGGGGGGEAKGNLVTVAADLAKAPTPGGEAIFALEATNDGGWGLAEAQLAISGIQVARAVYDTLTAPGADGKIHPFLAESVTPNADATSFAIKLREGVKFHDGTDLTATVVKNNIDAYRGKYAGRSPLLFSFVFGPYVKDVTADDATGTVTVTTNQQWPAFPWYLWSSGRVGIMAQAQLDSQNCDTDMIGTGPFKKGSFTPGPSGQFVAVKNPDYWGVDEKGVKYPYLDKITYKVQPSSADMLKGLQAGDYDIIQTSGAIQINSIRKDANIHYIESDKLAEVAFLMLNTTKADGTDCGGPCGEPFNNIHARKAVAHAIDRAQVNKLRNLDLLQNASGPFAQGVMGYLPDAGYPTYDPEKSKAEVAAYEKDTGKKLEFTITLGSDPETAKTAALLQTYLQRVGITANTQVIGDQTQYISQAIGKKFQAIFWRNYPGADPDTLWVWWHCDNPTTEDCSNPVNFGGFNDAVINENLEKGRTELDEAKRPQHYEAVNRRFSEQVYAGWAQWTLWNIATKPGIWGLWGPKLPDGTGPSEGLGTGIPVQRIWVEKK